MDEQETQGLRSRTLYGRRKGKKLRPGQQELLHQTLPALSITAPAEGERFDPRALFPGKKDVWLEIGFGAGEHLIWQAQQNPGVGFIGCEPFINGLARALGASVREGLSNIRFLQDDARFLLRALPEKSIGRAFILFPDPWPKLRHHKRRLVATPTLDLLAAALKDGAELRLATDDASYLPWMVEHATRHPAFQWLAERPEDWRNRPADWPPTRYEQKALKAARRPAYLRLVRRAR
jgi:tRNA (guanine-N7-)-methyltransferase